MTAIPSGSTPVPINRSELNEWYKWPDKLNHAEFIKHTQDLLDKNDQIAFQLSELYASNQEKKDHPPGKVLAVFESSLPLPFGKLIVNCCLHYRKNVTDIMYSIGFKEEAWTILTEHYIKREGISIKKTDLDPYLIAWISNHEEHLVRMDKFKNNLKVDLTKELIYEVIGQLAYELSIYPQKILDVNVFINALKTLDLNSVHQLWDLYLVFSKALENEELATRFKKQTQLSSYFEKRSFSIL